MHKMRGLYQSVLVHTDHKYRLVHFDDKGRILRQHLDLLPNQAPTNEVHPKSFFQTLVYCEFDPYLQYVK